MEQKPEIMHLMVIEKCDRKCELCCNKLYNIEELPIATVEELRQVHTVCITGGEPFKLGAYVDTFAGLIKEQFPNVKNVYVYTSGDALWSSYWLRHWAFFMWLDGINFAPKNINDWDAIKLILEHSTDAFRCSIRNMGSNRLYVFKNQVKMFEEKYSYVAKELNLNVIYRKWDKQFKTPANEIFRRLPIFLG